MKYMNIHGNVLVCVIMPGTLPCDIKSIIAQGKFTYGM